MIKDSGKFILRLQTFLYIKRMDNHFRDDDLCETKKNKV